MQYLRFIFGAALVFFVFAFLPVTASAATLSLSPNSGALQVGSTVDVSVLLNTEGESVNTAAFTIAFPPDRLQVVSPSAGNSIIGVWTAQPQVDNQAGTVEFQGGIPGGVTVSRGNLATLTFRVKSVGSALVRFLDTSRILLNDGKGTDALRDTESALFQLTLPPPAGPIVISETHPAQAEWYPNSTVTFSWEGDADVEGYSYTLSDQPTEMPDDVVEGTRTSVTYRSVPDDVRYFHIRALRKGIWGGSTHFAVHVDTAPPADFVLAVAPSDRTDRHQPVIEFSTTDSLSGMSHYELKLVTRSVAAQATRSGDTLFIEVQSPYVPPPLDLGTYDILIRAYDKAGNMREVVRELSIVSPLFTVVESRGISLFGSAVLPWAWAWTIAALLLLGIAAFAWFARRAHRNAELRRLHREMPVKMKRELEELDAYRSRYGKLAKALLVAITGSLIISGAAVRAADEGFRLDPPLITTVSKHVSNQDIFYVGGKVTEPAEIVIIYLQDLRTGATETRRTVADRHGDWFYQHDTFLAGGDYVFWVQGEANDEESPPSAQTRFTVEETALQIGSSRLSYETLLSFSILLFIIIVGALLAYALFHAASARRKYRVFVREIQGVEVSIREGFATLRRDLEEELAVVHAVKMTRRLSDEEVKRENRLRTDLGQIESRLSERMEILERSGGADRHGG